MNNEELEIEEFKELIDSRVDKFENDKSELLKARLISQKKNSNEDEIILGLFRLKLMLEEEAKREVLKLSFYLYALTYVDLLYNTRKSFANDINFSETQVSLILTGKRPPTADFTSKIILHSTQIYKKLKIEFSSSVWFKIYHLDRMADYLNNQKKETISLKNINNILNRIK